MKIVFFTGAGISVPSGLPTYRGTNGMYTKDPTLPQRLTLDNWKKDPSSVLQAIFQMQKIVQKSTPNEAHHAIAALQNKHDVVVVTQNVDGLHFLAGSNVVHELHGNLFDHKTDDIGTRPSVVLFGEDLPGDVWDKAEAAINAADIVVAVGTSGDVVPAAYLLDQANELAYKKVLKFYYLSLDPPERYIPFATQILGSAEKTVPELCNTLD